MLRIILEGEGLKSNPQQNGLFCHIVITPPLIVANTVKAVYNELESSAKGGRYIGSFLYMGWLLKTCVN